MPFLYGALRFVLILYILTGAALPANGQAPNFKLLVFSKTEGYRHESIPAGVKAIRDLGSEHGFQVDATEDASAFTTENLARYDAVVFLNTSGDVLNNLQQFAFENYIKEGGGFAGIHGAAATEYDWSWYGELVGAFFDSHPEPQEAEILVLDRAHPSTKHLPPRWSRLDEWYNYGVNPRGDVHVLAVLNGKTYDGGEMGHDHPIAWAQHVEDGRAWYTGLGHTVESYAEPSFIQHILGGIRWVAGAVTGDANATLSSSFQKVELMTELTDPMELAVAHDGRVFVAERSGPIKMWDPSTRSSSMVGYIPVRMTVEDGLLGLTLDPNFANNGWIYVYYAPADGGPNRLSRLTFRGGGINPGSEKIILQVDTQYETCCHSAGSLNYGPDGNLFLSTGDNTDPYPLGGSSIDERPGHRRGDSQRTAANTNDLRGKILRIRPLPDGTYAIPEGNLFEGDSLHRPEIYTMGHRNPYRISVDPKTGWLYWGDVGIGNAPSEERGPWGWEEFNQAREPGFYGWPYFVGPNDPYRDFDYATNTPGPFFNPKAPTNDSPNNSGARRLPPSQPAMIWYTYGTSEEFPELGAGGMSAMAGPIYRFNARTAAERALPPYYDGSFFIYEWMRNWIKEVKLDDEGRLLHINPFLPEMTFVRPGDMEIGPDGRLYVIEWGETFWGSNPDARLVRLDYVGGRQDSKSPRAVRPYPSVEPAADLTDLDAEIVWPPNGGIFDYGVPIHYEVSSSDKGQDLVVRTYSGHDTHAHFLDQTSDLSGTVAIARKFIHVPDLHFTNRFGVIELATDSGRDRRTNDERGFMREAAAGHRVVVDRVVLRPRQLEAEYVSSLQHAERQTYGKHPAEPDFAETALTVMKVDSGGYLAYSPLNLTGVDTIVVRVKPASSGTIEVRVDSLNGPVLGTAQVDSTAGRTPRNGSLTGQPDGILHNQVLAGLSEDVRQAYSGWRDIPIAVSRTGSRRLYLIVLGASSGTAMQVDHIRFIGPGVARRVE